jgi:hypothetical protein
MSVLLAVAGWSGLLIHGLIMLLVLCVIAALAIWILGNIPGIPAWFAKVIWAIVGIIILIWVVANLSAFGMG